MTFNEAIAILVDEEDHTRTLQKAAELGDAEKVQMLFESAVKEWKAGDSDEEFVAAILYLCAMCCIATTMEEESNK